MTFKMHMHIRTSSAEILDKYWPKSRRFTGEFKNDCWTLADEGLDFKFDSKK
jgi:hypothetical protein